jgi:hypothetical protein
MMRAFLITIAPATIAPATIAPAPIAPTSSSDPHRARAPALIRQRIARTPEPKPACLQTAPKDPTAVSP